MEVRFSQGFVRSLRKHFSKSQAIRKIRQLENISPNQGKTLAVVKNIVLKEIREKVFRFYFIHSGKSTEILTEKELKERIIQFVAMSKKRDQQTVIDTLMKDLKSSGFKL